MNTARSTDEAKREPRGRLLFERGVILDFLKQNGLPLGSIESELSPFVGVRRLAGLLDVSPTWIRQLHRRGVLPGQLLKPPLEGKAA